MANLKPYREEDAARPEDEIDGSHITLNVGKKFSLAVILALILQMGVGVWGVSSYYTAQKENQQRFSEALADMKQDFASLKNELYTRREAAIQFDQIRSEISRHDREIADIRDDVRQNTNSIKGR